MSYEQQARDLLERIGGERAQEMTAGDLVELANLIEEVQRYRARDAAVEKWLREGESLFGGERPQATAG